MQAEDAGTMAGQATSGKATRVAASHGRAAHAHASHAHATHGQATRWQDTPLHAGGRTLVEASAGTGKTWTIAVLYLRLLLEQGLLPRQIVVTTFSDAAAQELRERIRARLVEVEQWACRAAAAQEPSVLPQDPRQSAPDHAALVGETLPLFADSQAAPTPTGAVATVPLQAPQSNDENAAGSDPAPDRAWALARWGDPGHARSDRLALQLALAELDHAPIGTLHSLCRRILADYPFECGHPFVAGELVAAESMHAELVDDCWRRLAHASEPLDFGDAQWWCAGRGNLAQHLRTVLRPGVRLAGVEQPGMLPHQLLDAQGISALEDWLLRIPPRQANSVLPRALRKLLGALASGGDMAQLDAKDIADLAKPLESQVRAAQLQQALAHPGSSILRALPVAIAKARVQALEGYRVRALQQMRERMLQRGQLTFDELVVRVHDAAVRPGSVLAERLFEQWPVALVDEFQDTDSLQFAILDRIYRHHSNDHCNAQSSDAVRGRLVMIGDPKQAIYRFRGGDIDAYLRAAGQAGEHLALATNHRSADAYVDALNRFYALAGAQLGSAGSSIAYRPVASSGRRAHTPYLVEGEPCATPLVLHYRQQVPEAQPERVRMALKACANQIAQVLQGGHRIGDAPVQAGDIAVLLPRHHDIRQLRALLQERGVPCVSAGNSSVLCSEWAYELEVFLHGVWQARKAPAVRAALATRLGGLDFATLAALRQQPDAWLQHAQRFEALRETWLQSGVLALVRTLLAQEGAALLASADGERALTDLRHLGELLQQAEADLHGPEQLLAWLRRQRSEGTADADAASEQQLRIESEQRRVRLLTLHASKGLEFPLVFLPLMWNHCHSPVLDRIAVVGDGANGRVVAFDEASERRYRQEAQDERFRVLYVALTRAIHACHVYVLPPERSAGGNTRAAATDPERSALDASIERLLQQRATQAHGPLGNDGAGDRGAAAEAASGSGAMRSHSWSDGPLAWDASGWPWQRPPRAHGDAQAPAPRHVLPMPERAPFRASYSFSTLLRSNAGLLQEQAASDELEADAPAIEVVQQAQVGGVEHPVHPLLQGLAGVRGAAFGNAVHAVFEHRHPGVPITAQLQLVRASLQEHAVALGELPLERAAELVAARVQACLEHPIGEGLRLGDLPGHALRAEMGFHYVLDGVDMERLRLACAEAGAPELVPRVRVRELNGLMTGKIDLLFEHAGRFHLLDYKGNFLGEALEDYLPEALQQRMDQQHYGFQALLYAIALERMLRARLPGYQRAQHLGDAWYLFVRAVGASGAHPHAGIWRQRFSDRLLDAADAVLASRTGGTA